MWVTCIYHVLYAVWVTGKYRKIFVFVKILRKSNDLEGNVWKTCCMVYLYEGLDKFLGIFYNSSCT